MSYVLLMGEVNKDYPETQVEQWIINFILRSVLHTTDLCHELKICNNNNNLFRHIFNDPSCRFGETLVSNRDG